jgi:hypothetical protein
MPTLEKLEIQENECLFQAEITEEQKEEYLKWQKKDGDLTNVPDWVWELDWDLENERPGSDNLISLEITEGE